MKAKRILSALLAAGMAVSMLASCGENSSDNSNTSAAESNTQANTSGETSEVSTAEGETVTQLTEIPIPNCRRKSYVILLVPLGCNCFQRCYK